MPDYEPDGLQARIVATLDLDAQTIKRTQWTAWSFTVTGPFTIRVTNESWGAEAADHAYDVTIAETREGIYAPIACSCPAAMYHSGACKHRAAVAIVGGPKLIGDAVTAETAEYDTDGGRAAVDGGPRVTTNTLSALLADR